MLELRDITKIYNPGTVTEQTLFDRFSLTVEDGQFVSIVGSNGSGKTSLLNIICGSIGIEGGDILMDGKSISKLKDYHRYASMGRVYQDPSAGTCPNLTVLENLSLADNKGRPSAWPGASPAAGWRTIGTSWPPWAWGWRISWRCAWAPSPAASARRWRC
jgi:ABC-type uncharacterized transport system ATPase component